MISIIIPAFNEEQSIGGLVCYLNEHSNSGEAEIIVVDGGSTDQTISEAKKAGATVVRSPRKGRASQMNVGAEKARGDLLYFLHADTVPPATFIHDITRAVEKGYSSGCFRLNFDSTHKALKLYSWFTRFDLDVFRFGDQSLFVTKELFYDAGRFDEDLVVMEDQEIIKRLKDHAQFSIIAKPVITSARKYERIGVFKLQMIFTIIVCLFYFNISQETIVHFYRAIIEL